MKAMTTRELKQKYLNFFEEKGHKIISGSSLIPENDPTALFISAGMHPLVPYLLGEKHPAGKRLVDVQKSIRTSDIDEVGDDVHLTFFEMLGNWSLGDYWKKEAIEMSWEFLTDKKWLGLDKDKISVTVFAGDADAPFDEESYNLWLKRGIPKERIAKLPKKDNFWGPAGKTGPCGPCTEMFYQGIEIWNDVFMEFNKTTDGKYEPLKQKNVDTGMGVERTVAILNGKKSVFAVEPIKSIVEKVRKLAKSKDEKSERIIADHLRAATFIMGDEKGIAPSNVEQGYVLRRLIRRAIRYGKKIGIEKAFTHEVSKLVIELMSDEYLELNKNKDFILEQLVQEEERFKKTLEKGLKKFNEYVLRREPDKRGTIGVAWDQRELWGKYAFDLYQTFGFPKEIMQDLCRENNIKFDERGFEEEFKKHQELSRTATAGKFKSGLADNSEAVTKLHTATHLLLAALRKVLGEHVYQKGSNITAERLRLDFSHSEKMTAEQLKKVEDAVNEVIVKDLPVNCYEVSLEKAKEIGAMGVFESKYRDKVKIYSVGMSDCPFSCEICAGPHIKKTGELGHFKILKEEASSAGVRRIKAVLE
jgi:alanyl-tRNA synthetase